MPKPRPEQWDDPHFAPGQKRRAREAGAAWYWLPRAKDIANGFRPKSRELPRGDDDAAVRARAVLCREYERELIEWRESKKPAKPQAAPGTFTHIAHLYEHDPESPFHELRYATQHTRRYHLKAITKRIGRRRIASTTGKDLRRWHGAFRDAAADPARGWDGLETASSIMKLIRILAKYAVIEGHEDCARVAMLFENISFKGGKARTMAPTWEDVQALQEAATAAGRPSIGLATLMQYELAQRQGDIIGVWEPAQSEDDTAGIVHRGRRWSRGVLWSDIDADWKLTICQNKGGRVLQFPLFEYPVLLATLKAVPPEKRVGPIIISEKTGRPYRRRDFSDNFRKIAKLAGWPDALCSMDSRAGAATEIAEAVQELAMEGRDVVGQGFVRSHTGHRDEKMEERYTRSTWEMVSRVARMRQARREKKE